MYVVLQSFLGDHGSQKWHNIELTPLSSFLLPKDNGKVEMSVADEQTESAGDGLLSRSRSGTFKYAISESLRSSISMNCGLSSVPARQNKA